MTSQKDESLVAKYTKVIVVVTMYWIVSISMVFLNKRLLGGASMGSMDAPLFITAFQCLVSAALCVFFSKLASLFPNYINFPTIGTVEPDKCKKVFPLTIMFVAMMSMNNLSLKYVGVAFYYVGRSLTTVFNVIFTFLILGEKTSLPALICCGVIVAGFWLGVDQEGVAGSLSMIGLSFGVMASASVSLNAIFTKKVLPAVDGSIWLLSYYNNLLAVLLFIPLIVVTGELPAIQNIILKSSWTYWSLMLVSGILGFAIGFVTGLQIKVTSPLTHNVSGTAKACAQTVIATYWFDESKAFLWWLSNWIVLGGSIAYTRVKQLQMKATHLADVKGKSEEAEPLKA